MNTNKLTTLILFIILFSSCAESENEKDRKILKKYNNVYEKMKDENLKVLFDISIQARQEKDGKMIPLSGFIIYSPSGKNIELPTSIDKIDKGNIYNLNYIDIKEFIELKNIEKDEAYNELKKYTDSILTLYHKSGVYKITGNPQLGEFIRFYLKDDEFISYAPDTNKIFHEYWKKYFREAKTLDSNWYYRSP